MLKVFNCDLHIHTCLSPCAELDMHPKALVERAIARHLDLIAISDHNASANVPYVMAAAAGKNIRILPAMEVTTREEVHLLALFGRLSGLQELQSAVDRHLFGENDEDRFGVQAVVNELGEVEGLNHQLLIGATDLPIDEIVDLIHRLEGLAVPAHIDRESFSVLSQLGFIEESSRFDALEISKHTGLARGRLQYPELGRYPFWTSSDAHFLQDIGTSTTLFLLEEPTFDEIRKAVLGQDGRRILEDAC
ncbi:MAG TPA: PHP domain-containing protein [Smithellaceae bacterium]|nr:PHP domain-containing protein [Smithellaceae bacterium]HRS81991.1 PHP domain-containing protein [Smithellaceae bacterium]HRV44283.1 PHP domain-containing protein [Smithellaceae bacterium]